MQQRYKTRQREAILSYLREHAEHCFSAKQLCEALKNQGHTAGVTTVYRTLDLLVRENSVKRFDQGKAKGSTYQYATKNPSCEHHLHLKCRACGELFHLECSSFASLHTHLHEEHGFHVNQADTILYGICRACAEENA